MSKADDLYYQYRRKLNQENGTRQGYRREKSSGQGTRNERYINEVLGGQGQPVQPSQASTSAPKTRQQILQEYRNGIKKSAAPSTTSSPVYSPDGAFFPKKNPYEGTTTKRPNPFEKVPYSDPLARAFNEKTGWRDPGMQALYELAERVQAQNNRKNFASSDPIGRMGAGNIDLYNRPQYRQPDGSLSTVNSISIGTDEGEVLIPTIGRDAKGNPVQWTDDEAIENFFRTGEYLGKFKTPEEADRYAEMLHNQQEAYYSTPEQRKITPASVFRSGPIAGSDIGPRSRSFEAANRAAKAEKEAAEQSAAGIQFDRSEAVKRRQSNIIPPETIESITDQYDMRPSYMRQQGDLPAAQDDRTRKALEQIYNSPIRVNQDNPVVEGFVRGTGIPSIINAGVNAVGAATGDQDMRNRINREYASYLQQSQQLAENNPIAYGAGSIAGNIALMSGIGKVIGAGAGAINTASTAGRAALRMGASALNFAATTAIQEAGAAAGGFTTPDNYARDVLVSGGAGMASAVASMAVAGGLEKVLSKSGLGGQYVFLDYLKNLSSVTAGAGARVGVDYAAINKAPTDAFRQAFISNHPGSTEEDIQKAYVNSLRQRAGEQFVTAFVFNLISSYMDTLRSTERAHYDLQREYDELEQVMEAYGKNPPRNAAEAAQWANDVHTEAGRVRSRLNNGYYAGQQDKIDKILPLLDEIDERANQWASNYSGISGPAPASEPTPEFVQEIGAAMQQGAENPPAVITPEEPTQAPEAQEMQPQSRTESAAKRLTPEKADAARARWEEAKDNLERDIQDRPRTDGEVAYRQLTSEEADAARGELQRLQEEAAAYTAEREATAARLRENAKTLDSQPTTTDLLNEIANTPMPPAEESSNVNADVDNINADVKVPTTETTVPTTEEVAPVEEKAPQEIAHVNDQIRAHAGDLSGMDPVSTVSKRLEIGDLRRSEKANSIANLFSDAGNKISVDGIGDVIIDKKRISNSLRYITTDLEYQAYQAIADVLQNGVVINEHGDHKGREYSTVTIAAPVQFDPPAVETPTRGNVAVVVKKTNGNYYKVYRVLTDDQMSGQNNYTISDADGLSNSRLSREVIDYGTGESGADLSGEGSRRAVSLRTGEPAGGVSSAAGRAPQGWKDWSAAADTGIKGSPVTLKRGVPAEEIIRTAEPGQVIYQVESGHTPSMMKAAAMVRTYDPKVDVVPFVSGNDIRVTSGETARAFVDPERRSIGYRANDERAAGDQLARHELIELGIMDGKVDTADALRHLDAGLKELIQEDVLSDIANAYIAGSNVDITALSPAEIEAALQHANKEMLCDIGAGINQFKDIEGYEPLSDAVEIAHDILRDYMNEKLGGAFDAEPESIPEAKSVGASQADVGTALTVLKNTGISVNDNGTVAHMEYSTRYSWKTREEQEKAAAALQKTLGVSKKKALGFIQSEMSLTNMILRPGNVALMDYTPDDRYTALKKNSDYPQGTFDFNNNCRKRVPFTTLFDRIQMRNPNRLFTADDLEIIRQNMIKHNYPVACALCYVEERRQKLGEIADSFVKLYENDAVLDRFVGKTPFEKMKAALESVGDDPYKPTIADLVTYEGLKKLEKNHKGIADAFRIFNNARGMQSGRLVEGRAEYKRELLTYTPAQVKRVNDLGGIRVFSYSDFEAVNLLDLVQIIQDAASKGIMIQAYTKVPAFAKVVRNTGIKLNRSLIAAGTGVKYENGKKVLDLDPVEGININDPDFFDSTDDRDVGNILVGMSDEQIRLAMASPFVDYIIPFHTSLPGTILKAKKIDHWKNYKLSQTDKDMKTWKNAKNINIYTEVLQAAAKEGNPIKNKKDFVNKFLQVAKDKNLIPRFSEFLNTDKDGNFVYTEGYHKFLIDFKLFDKNGNIVEQKPVRPVFDDAYNTKLMEDFANGVGSVSITDELYRDTVDALNAKSEGNKIQYSSKLNLSGKQGASGKQDSSGNELTVQQEEYFKDSKIRDEDGNLLVVYHGTYEDFTVFDKSKGRSNMDIQGSFFSPWDIDAEGYGPNVKTVYLNIKNPAPERVAYKALNMFKGQNGAGIKAREYLISRGYDGVNNGDEEYIAFYPEQIKNIDNLAPTENEDIRYSTKLQLQGKEIELTEREEKLVEQLGDSYLKRIEQVTAQKDAQIAELKEQMKAAVGAEKEKARQRIEKLRQEKNNRIAYLEKQWRKNTDWRIAELKRKAEAKRGEEHDDMIRRLAKLQAQKDKKIEEILSEHRRQRQEARDRRNDRKLRVKFQNMARKALRDAQMKPGLASERVKELLNDIDLTALGMRDATRTSLHNKLLEIMEMRKTDENYLALHAEEDWKKVERLFKKQIKDMSLEEVSDMITELSALIHYQETTDKLIRDEQNRSAAEVGRQIVSDLKELTPLDVTNPVKVLSAKFIRDNLSPERAFNRLSGYKRDSAMKTLYRQVLDGYTKVKSFEKKSAELFEGFEKDEKNKDFLQNAAKQTIPVTGKYGQTALISPAMRVSLYMASKNRDNQRHIATDGMTVPEPKAYAKGLIDDAYGRGTTIILEPTEIDKICAGMTESEKEFARLLETFFDVYAKEAINETSVDLDGVLKAIVDHYFPISSDKNFLAKSMDSFQDPTLEGWNNLKKRQEGANNKILLEDARQVLNRHIRNTARYYGLAIPLRNWNKVYGYTSHRDEFTGTRDSVQSAIKNAWNSDTAEYIERLIRDDINAGGRRAERGVMDRVRSSYAGSTLTLNAGVALKQTTSYFMAGSILDMESLMYGLSHKFTKADQEYMDSITPWGWARRQGESTIELGEMARRKDPITKNTPNWNQAMDVITTNALFTATERSIRKEYPGLKRGDTKYDEALAERYNQVLWRTQPQYEAAFRPEYLRKTDIGSRTFGMFKTESMQMSGELIDAWGQWRADEKRARSGSEQEKRQRGESAKHFYKTFASWIASNMSFAMMGTALNILLFHKGKPYRNDRGEIDWQTIATKTGMNFISSSLGGFMFASTAFDFGSYLFNIISGNKATWYDIEVPGISMINDMVTNTGDWVGTLLDEDATPAMKARATSKFALAASKFTPLGFAENLLKLADSVNLYVQDIREGIKTGDWHMYEAGDGFLQDTSPTKDQYAHQAVYYAGQGNVERAGRALKRTKKANLEKALGRKVGDTMFARFVENPQDLVSYMKTVASNGSSRTPKLSDVPEHGFSSFTKLKEGLGSPNRNENWHHIVEQEQGPGDKNFGTFTATQINNANNVVSISSGAGSVHKAITDYYGSVQDFTDGLTVREWLAKNKSFEEQFDFGIEQLRKFGDVAPTERGWVFIPNEEKIDEIPLKEGKAKELTASQKRWDTKIAEAREDGGLTDREIHAAALEMLNEGTPKDEVVELYKSRKKDKYIDDWMNYDGESGGDLGVYFGFMDAKALGNQDGAAEWLNKSSLSDEEKWALWELAGWSEKTFDKKVN